MKHRPWDSSSVGEPIKEQVDAPLVNSTLNPIGLHDIRDNANSRVKNIYLGFMRKPLHKFFNLLIYGRSTNTFRDRQKD